MANETALEERPIAFNLLKKDELEYEVTVRLGVPLTTVMELRSQLRKLNQEIPTDEVADYNGDVKEELDIISAKMDDLRDQLQSPTQRRTSLKLLNRVQAVAHHLYHRLTRLTPAESEASRHCELSDQLDKLLSRLDNVLINFRSALSRDVALEVDKPNPTALPACTKHHNLVQKLNLKYDGKTCVKAFLRKLEQVRVSRDIPDSTLFRSACELFTDEASSWFNGICDQVHCWTDLKAVMIRDYLPLDYNVRLMREIRARTQGFDESIVNYVSVMLNYFSRLETPLPEAEKLSILVQNVRPFYSKQLALFKIESIGELKDRCRQLEAATQSAKRFAEPDRDLSKSLAHDLVYKPLTTKTVSAVQASADFCVRCRVDGHTLKTCKAAPKLVCYRCGENDVTARTCPKCASTPSTSKN
ncbi:uncharacterized protein LOC134667231 [Cydia fagiglandana]|uniref:uncharacterized protein LOC134667231 n=1 Tax=Cydia fagiglandana TaxID=1458189 RepID=UPI002FEE4F2F